LFIDKALQKPKWSGLFLEPFKGHELSKNKVQWLNFAFQTLIYYHAHSIPSKLLLISQINMKYIETLLIAPLHRNFKFLKHEGAP
jgi:hypothetical protein